MQLNYIPIIVKRTKRKTTEDLIRPANATIDQVI